MQVQIVETELVTRRRWHGSIREAWGGQCAYCGSPAQSIDHVIPRSQGGLTVRENCVPACLACNGSKGSREVLSWWRQQPGWSLVRQQRLLEWVGNGHGVEPNHLCGAQQLPAACKAVQPQSPCIGRTSGGCQCRSTQASSG
jgi:hypothetical protein